MTNSMNLNDVANASLVAEFNRVEQGPWGCQPGSAKDVTIWMADDFDAPLEDFDETAP